jgi:hypothetical protein
MGPLDALWHLANLFTPAVAWARWRPRPGQAAVAARTGRCALAAPGGPACLACAVVTLAGLVLLGRDGKMATYAGMVLACALTLWWRGFGPGRR